MRTVRRHGRTGTVGSFPFPTREEARLAQQGVEGLQRTFPGNPDLGSRARVRPDPRRHEAAHSNLAIAASEADAATVSAALLASELSNDGLFIVLLRAVCPEEELLLADGFGDMGLFILSVVQQSPETIALWKAQNRRGEEERFRRLCATEDWCSARRVRMVSVKHSPPLAMSPHRVGAASTSERTSAHRCLMQGRS